MKIPFARYAIYCILEEFSTEELKKHFDDLSLPDLSDTVVSELEEDAENLPLPRSTRRAIQRKTHDQQAWAFLDKLGYGELYLHRCKAAGAATDDWEAIWKVMANPVQRVALESALLAGVAPQELEAQLSAAAGARLAEATLTLYSQYFFDKDSMRKADWRDFLAMCAPHTYVYSSYLSALTRPKNEVLHKVGIPTKIQLSDMLNQFVATAYFKFQRYAAHDTPESDDQARKWAKLGAELGVRADKVSAGDANDFAAAIQSEFEYLDAEIPMVAPEMLSDIRPPAPEAVDKSKLALHASEQPEQEV